jgi:site-specific recombinase XerD
MYATGARAQEICDLTVSSVRFSSGGTTIEIVGKGNKRRRVRISDHASTILRRYIEKQHIEHSPNRHIFSSQTHEQMTISCIEEIVRKYVKQAQDLYPDKFLQGGYSPHSFRHTTATHMIEAGVPLTVIKNFLGHASIQTTQVYAELTQNTIDKHILEWNEKWFPRSSITTSTNNTGDNMPDFLKP